MQAEVRTRAQLIAAAMRPMRKGPLSERDFRSKFIDLWRSDTCARARGAAVAGARVS